MIASRLSLAIVTAIAIVLAVIVGIDFARDDAPTSRALVPGFDAAKVARITWAHGNESSVTVVRAGKGWRLAQPDIPANPEAIENALSAMRGARWHRRAPIAQAGALQVAMTAGDVEIGVGQPVEGAAQTWVAIGEHAYLVDDWVARAFAPEPLALREVHPFRHVASAKTILVDHVQSKKYAVRIEGMRMARPIEVRLDPQLVTALHRALADMTIVAIPQRAEPTIVMTISIDAPLVNVDFLAGGCENGQTAISGTYGPGCIEAGADSAIQKALFRFTDRTADLADPVPARVDPMRITLTDGGVLDLEKRPRAGDHDADPLRVAELLAVLSSPLEVTDEPQGKPVGSLTVTARDGEVITLELLPGYRIRRQGEPVALMIGNASYDILRRGIGAFRDPTLWTEDPLTITSITIDGKVFARGAVVGEWSAGDAQALTALAEQLARPQATEIPKPPAVTRSITFEVAPPSGSPSTRTLQIGAGCSGIVDNRGVRFDAQLCTTLARVK